MSPSEPLWKALLRFDAENPEDELEVGDPAEMMVPGDVWATWMKLARQEAPKPYRWGIIACSATKGREAAPARDLYQGQLFKASLAAAEALCDRVVILSALLGVVDPGQLVEPYDRRAPTTRRERDAWAKQVHRQLFARGCRDFEKPGLVLCLAPASYWSCLNNHAWDKPLAGLGIGRQKAKLKSLLEER